MTTTALIGYLVVAATVAAIIKVLSSGRGRVDMPGLSIQWSK